MRMRLNVWRSRVMVCLTLPFFAIPLMPVAQLTWWAFFPGAYLLSGGLESVLVVWQVETHYRKYLPRLGNEILSISINADQTLYAVGLASNAVKVVSAVNFELVQTVQGLKPGTRAYAGGVIQRNA